MKKRLIAVLMLTLAMLMLTAQAGGAVSLDPTTTKINNATYHEDGKSLKSVDVHYIWPSDQNLSAAKMYLAVFNCDIGNGNTLFDKYYRQNKYTSLSDAITAAETENKSKGAKCVAYSTDEIRVNVGDTVNAVFSMNKDVIPLAVDHDYYVYIISRWSQDGSGRYFYPDARIGTIRVQGGKVTVQLEGSSQVEDLTPETKPEEKPGQSETKPEEKPETKPEEKPTAEVKKAAESMPKTGDESLPLLYLALGLGCCAALAVMKRRKA